MAKALQSLLILFFIVYSKEAFCKKHVKGSRHGKSGDNKIVGGYNTTIQSVPYQAYLILQKGQDYYQCGGSILDSRNILTASHCVRGMQAVYARIGTTDSEQGGSTYYTTTFLMHPQYNPNTYDYDVAIVKFPQGMTLDGKSAKAVSLASETSTVSPGTQLLVTGWGATAENSASSRYLMAVKVPTISNQDCNKSYGSTITSRMICAGESQGGKDSCQGDSGGPAVSQTTGKQVGIVSFGVGCARAGYPGVYSNVAALRTWIRTNTLV